MSAADVPGADARTVDAVVDAVVEPAVDVDPVARARTLLDRAEAGLASGDLASTEAMLGEMADILAASDDRSSLIGQALWLAAMVSLARGQAEDFARTSASAIEGFALAGDEQTASALRLARTELIQRVDHEQTVRQRGASGFLEVLVEQARTLLARARGQTSWDMVDRDRDHLAALVTLLDRESVERPGDALPLARLMQSLELNAVESMIVAVLVPLSSEPELAAQARALAGEPADAPGVSAEFLARLLFTAPSAHDAVVAALAPQAPLMRYRVVRQRQAGSPVSQRVDVEPAILWFMRDTAPGVSPLPAGVRAYRPEDFWIDVAPPLSSVVDTLTQAFTAPRSSFLVLAGRPGTGKLTAALAAAAQARRPLIAVDADALTGPQLADAMVVAIRDAFLHGAVLLIRWQWQRQLKALPAPIRAAMDELGLRLCLATTPAHGQMALNTARRMRADVVEVSMPAVSESEQHLAWRESLATLGLQALDDTADDELQARLCRPGLAVGDIVESIVEAMARSDAQGQPVTVPDLAACLDQRLVRELETWAEVLAADERPLTAALPAAVAGRVAEQLDAMAETILGGQLEVDEMGLYMGETTRRERVVGCVAGGRVQERALVAQNLARRSEGRLARLDMNELLLVTADTALAHLRDTAAAAGRAGAILLVENADALIGAPNSPLAGGLGRLLDERPASFLLGVEQEADLPLALAVRIDEPWVIALDEVS